MNFAHAFQTTDHQPTCVSPVSFPTSRSDVTESWLRQTLDAHPRFQEDPILTVSLQDLGDGIGQMSALTLASLVCASGRQLQLVVKLQAPVPEMHQVALSYGHYDSEVGFYTEMASDIPMRTPDIYVCAIDELNARVVLIMEAFTDWQSPDQISGATAEQVAIAVAELAGLASTYWNTPPTDEFSWLKTADDPVYDSLSADYAACLPILLERFRADWPDQATGTLTAISENYAGVRQAIIDGTQVLSHWDFRVENLFFRADGELAVIDWQLMHADNPANDLAYLLATNVEIGLRREIEADIMAIYLKALREQGIEGYGMANLVADYRLALLSISAIPVIGGANADVGNRRSRALFSTMGARLLAAIDDWQAVEMIRSL
jgi:hypothetical protein